MKRITRKCLAIGLCLSMLVQPVYSLAAEGTELITMESQGAEEGEAAALPGLTTEEEEADAVFESGIVSEAAEESGSDEVASSSETEQPAEEAPASSDNAAVPEIPQIENEDTTDDAVTGEEIPADSIGETRPEEQNEENGVSAADAIEEMQGLLEEQGLTDDAIFESDVVTVEEGELLEESFEGQQDAAGAQNNSSQTGTTENGVYRSTSGTTVGGIKLMNIGSASGNPVISAGATVNLQYSGAARWESSNPAVASISETGGVLVALKEGEVTINVYTSATSTTPAAHVDLTVSPRISLRLNKTAMTLDADSSTASFAVKQFVLVPTLSANAKYRDRILQELYYESSNTNVVQVDDKSGTLYATSKCGSAVVSCYAAGFKVDCDVTVEQPISDIDLYIQGNSAFDKDHKVTLEVGDQELIRVRFLPADNTEIRTVTWSSKNAGCAKVDKNGVVSAVKPGSATIVAQWKDKKNVNHTKELYVTVENPVEQLQILNSKKKQVSLVYLNIAENSQTLSEQLSVKLLPANPTGTGANFVEWSSSNTSVCSVTESGTTVTITAKGEGYATIEAKCQGVKASVVVKVTHDLERITADNANVSIAVGQAYNLKEKLQSKPVEYQQYDKWVLKWTTANKNYVTVEDGVITGVKAGGPVKVTVSSGKVKYEFYITVTKVKTGGISVDSKSMELEKGGRSRELTVSKAPNSNVTYVIDDPSIISVTDRPSSDEDVCVYSVSPLKGGTAKITFTAYYTETGRTKSMNTIVKVVNPVRDVIIKNSAGTEVKDVALKCGDVLPLSAEFSPEDATDKNKPTWKTSRAGVATVDANGVVRAKGPGQCQIFAKIGAGGSQYVTISVTRPLIDIRLSKTSLTLNKGQTSALSVTYNPSNVLAETKYVEWTSSNSGVATVVDGKVYAAGPGECVITARSLSDKEGKISASCNVTVAVPLTKITYSMDGAQTMYTGTEQTLTMNCEPYDTTFKIADTKVEPEWKSSNTNVITVERLSDGKCRIKAVYAGTAASANATVTCTYKGTYKGKLGNTNFSKSYSMSFTVRK